MKLSQVKEALANVEILNIVLPNGDIIPSHFHITEIGESTKFFIDCGGTTRKQSKINFQLWTAEDIDHRLQATKLKNIIALAERTLNLLDAEIEVEYQGKETIEKYGMEYNNGKFYLQSLKTDCLAKEKCGIPEEKLFKSDAPIEACTPGSGCC